jgi:hypothetical protein
MKELKFPITVDHRIVNMSELTLLDRFVFAWIVRYCRQEPGASCFQSNVEIAEFLKVSEGGVHKSIARLADMGHVHIKHEGKIRHLISKLDLLEDPDWSIEGWEKARRQSTFQVLPEHLSGAPPIITSNNRLVNNSSNKSSPPKLPQKDVKKNYLPTSLPYQLADILISSVMVNQPGTYQRYEEYPEAMEIVKQNSAHQINKLLEDEKKDQLELLEVLQFSQGDYFWRDNIRSGHKFRIKYEDLLKQMKSEGIGSYTKDPNEKLTKAIIGAFRALINNPGYQSPPKDYSKFVKASVCLKNFFEPRNISTESGVEYLLRCLDKEYGNNAMTIYPGHMCSDHTWEVLMPQYMLEVGL